MKTLLPITAMVLLAATMAFPAPITYVATLNGATEEPATPSPGTGTAEVIIDTTANTLFVDVSFTGLLAGTTASHIHCCTAASFTGNAGVATTVPTFAGFPLGVTSGTYINTLDLTSASSYNPAFVTFEGGTIAGAEAALAAGMAAGRAYVNIHTTQFPGGEIEGFLVVATPEPTTFLLTGISLLAFAVRRRTSVNRRA
jgi:hypothetical protein